MNARRLCLATLHTQPWLMLPSFHAALAHRVNASVPANAMPDDDDDGGYAVRDDGVAVVELSGVMLRKPDMVDVLFGALDTDGVADDLMAAVADPEVRAIVLSIDSPGGGVTGTPELAAAVRAATDRKPVIAYTDTLMASAAYWVGSQATEVVIAPSAEVGSIGVYAPYLNMEGMYEAAGVKLDLVKSAGSPLKAAGAYGLGLTDEQRAHEQAQVDYLYDQFSAAVSQARRPVADAMRGQVLIGQQAVDARLADRLGSLRDAIELAGAWASRIGTN